jgi:RNA-directed DNA polymerase
LTYPYPRKFSPGRISIVDNDVFDRRNVNVALPKTQFASHVLNEEPGFAEPDISGFEPLFDMLQAILFG